MMVLRKNRRSRKGYFTAKLLVGFGFLIVTFFTGRQVFIKTQEPVLNGRKAVVSSAVAATTLDPSSWSKVRERTGLYEVKYPRSVFKVIERHVSVPPFLRETAKAVVLSRQVEGGSEGFADLEISFFVVDRNFNDILAEIESIQPELSVVTVDGHQGIRFVTTDTAPKVVYLILPANDAKTMFIGRSSLSKEEVSGSESSAGILDLKEQDVLFEEIMRTFYFRQAYH